MPRIRQSDNVTLLCSIEGPTAFKMDGDGSGQIKLTVPPSEIESLKQLMSGYREHVLVAVFVKRR